MSAESPDAPATVLDRALFIGGCDRSGTTLLAAMLGVSPRCHVTPESPFKIQAVTAIGSIPAGRLPLGPLWTRIRRSPRWNLWNNAGVGPGPSDGEYGQLLLRLASDHAGSVGIRAADVWVDHTPSNIRYARILDEILPASRFIHLVRDGRAVCSSLLPLPWGPGSPMSAAMFWKSRIAEGLAVEQDRDVGGRVMRVHYEALVARPESTLRSICDFAGLEYHPEMPLGHGFTPPPFTADQHSRVGTPPSTERIDAWRSELKEVDVASFEWTAGPVLNSLGYQCEYWPFVERIPLRRRARYLWADRGPPALAARLRQWRRERSLSRGRRGDTRHVP